MIYLNLNKIQIASAIADLKKLKFIKISKSGLITEADGQTFRLKGGAVVLIKRRRIGIA